MKNIWRKSAISLTIIVMACASSCQNPDQDQKTNCQQLDEIDLQMLNMIKQINANYQNNEVFLEAFKESQIYWIQYRNRQVKAIFPLSPNKYDYDVGDCKCEIYRDLTALRVKELQRWIDGVAEGSNCQGTYQIK